LTITKELYIFFKVGLTINAVGYLLLLLLFLWWCLRLSASKRFI